MGELSTDIDFQGELPRFPHSSAAPQVLCKAPYKAGDMAAACNVDILFMF